MLRVKSLYKSYGSLIVLSDVSFSLMRGQRAALVGRNGVGKSTLLKVLAGREEADSGNIEFSKNIRIGYLPQDMSLVGEETIECYLRRETGIDVIDVKQYDETRERYEERGGDSFAHRVEVMRSGFGLDDVGLDRPLSSLSSGQKSKVVLIAILLKKADLLLFDEPTNNLDLSVLIWLEDFIRDVDAACIIISHDRRFLDRTATKIFELDWETRGLNVTGGTYTDYLRMAAKRRQRQKEEYKLQQEEIGRLSERAREMKMRAQQGARWAGTDKDKFLRGFKRDRAARSGKGAKALEKRIEQMEKIEKPVERPPFEIPLEAAKEYGDLNIRLINVMVGYPSGFSIGPISLEIRYGERVGIMGLNGSGKSTLLKVIAGYHKPEGGQVEIGPSVRFGDMMQEHDFLPRQTSLLEFLKTKIHLPEQDAYALLTKFGLSAHQAKQAIRALSPGGRARLLLAVFSALSVNTLLLDEPTNHLDIEAMEALEEALESYRGTVILVSHDRFFLEKARLNSTFLLEEGKLTGIESYRVYVSSVEKRAKRLLRLL